jgi:hypothetical protein
MIRASGHGRFPADALDRPPSEFMYITIPLAASCYFREMRYGFNNSEIAVMLCLFLLSTLGLLEMDLWISKA